MAATERHHIDTRCPIRSHLDAACNANLCETCPRSGAVHADARRSSWNIVLGCERYAASVQYQNVTLAQLGSATGASQRRVRYAFQECFGASPTATLRVMALCEAHVALVDHPRGRNAVSRAAMDFGFWHLSRFARAYRAKFGESPRATVARNANAA